MKLLHTGIAGSLESSDVQITVEPSANGIELSIESTVISQYGKAIKATILKTLEKLEVENAKVTVVDKGATDVILKSRVECAVFRAVDQFNNLPWGVKI